MAKKDPHRRIIRSSRKGYIPYYLMIISLASIIGYIFCTGRTLNSTVALAAAFFMALLLKLTEVDRFSHHYELTPVGLEKVEGIFFKKFKRMSYRSISQLHSSQNPWQRLLGYGSVEIAQFSETVRTEIKNINKPDEFVHYVSEMMHRKNETTKGEKS